MHVEALRGWQGSRHPSSGPCDCWSGRVLLLRRLRSAGRMTMEADDWNKTPAGNNGASPAQPPHSPGRLLHFRPRSLNAKTGNEKFLANSERSRGTNAGWPSLSVSWPQKDGDFRWAIMSSVAQETGSSAALCWAVKVLHSVQPPSSATHSQLAGSCSILGNGLLPIS